MKTTLLVFCALFSLNTTFAQLYVKDAFLYNKGAMVYVRDYVELNTATSFIYLRNEGQLLQGSTVLNGVNRGLGNLSVFQEGTVNNFAYNYWCSPVGNPSTFARNENFGVSLFNVPTTNTASNPASIITGYNGTSAAGALSISNYWIFRLLALPDYSGWLHSYSNIDIAAGQGFTMKGVSGDDITPLATIGEATFNNPLGSVGINNNQRYDFRGKPNDGDITIGVANNNYTLTGNPYPSAIDLSAFLFNAANCTGIAYFWEQDKSAASHALLAYRGGYGTFSPVSRGGTGIYVPAKFYSYNISGVQLPLTETSPNNSYARLFAPVGQGFMIQGNALGTTVTMRNSYRVFEKENVLTSVFEKTSNATNTNNSNFLPPIMSVSGFDYTTVSTTDVPQIRINTLLNNQAIKQVVLAFDNEATDGVDHAKDARNPDDSSVDMNFLLNDKDYIISVIQFDENKRLPVSFKSNNATTSFKITVAEIRNFDQANNIYLYDNETGLYHDIKNNQYEFTLPAGIFNNRFEITFKDATALGVENPIKESITIIQNNTSHQLNLLNPNLMEIKAVTLFDITGKRLFNKTKLGIKDSYEFSTVSLSDAVYLVKVETNDGQSFGQKIIVSSR